MPIYALGEWEPDIDATAFVHPDAVVIGDVRIGAESSVWPGAVLRGDAGGHIVIGERSSVQDNAVLHTTPNWPTIVGSQCTLGHLVHLEGCTLADNVLIGNAAMVLHRCTVGSGAIVAANSVVLDDTHVEPGALAVGTPAVVKPGKARADLIELSWRSYAQRSREYPIHLRRIG
ncbi:MAG: gamma carbonic anhydrase family protein [Ilumatobacteraceae bacterium]|nr:gamma carbonic anhydrase family protein [Ilumatobacteraceae bacterium]